jgi:predicted kinase
MFVLVGGWPGSGKTTLSTQLAAHLHLPLLSKDVVKQSLMDHDGVPADVAASRRVGEGAVVAVLTVARQLDGAVIDSTWLPYSRPLVERLPGVKVELRCTVPRRLAEERYGERLTRLGHFDAERHDDELWRPVPPLGVGPLVEVDTSGPVDLPALAARLRQAARGMHARLPAFDVLERVYAQLLGVVRGLAEAEFQRGTRAAGWTVHDLLVHMLMDPQRALVTFATPGGGPPDVDAVTYWHDFHPAKGDGGASHAEFVRGVSEAYGAPQWLVGQLEETLPAVVRAGRECRHPMVATQGHVLTVADFVDTLLLEVTVHYLDLTAEIPGPPPPGDAVEAVAAVLDGLLGSSPPSGWDGVAYVLKGTGRLPLTEADRTTLGAAAGRFPLLG